MKKYISIVFVTAVIVLQSCERTDSIYSSENEFISQNKISDEALLYKSEDSASDSTSSNQIDTGEGEDEEPRKDKSHWRIKTDTVR